MRSTADRTILWLEDTGSREPFLLLLSIFKQCLGERIVGQQLSGILFILHMAPVSKEGKEGPLVKSRELSRDSGSNPPRRLRLVAGR